MIVGTELQFALRKVRAMYESDFIELFGGNLGHHLWTKLTVVFERDVSRFICYLDLSNISVLEKYINQKIEMEKK